MNAPKSKGQILIETSVLISFLKIQRLDILGKLDRKLLITEEVDAEINGERYPFQREHLDSHVNLGTIEIVRLELTSTIELKSKMSSLGPFGTGECSTAAKALELNVPTAMTDEAAVRRFLKHYPTLQVLSVEDLFIELFSESLLTVADADLVLPSWSLEAQNPVPNVHSSFADIFPN